MGALRQGVLGNIFRKAFGRIKIKHAPLGSNPRLRGNGRCALPTELDLSQECHGTIRMLRHGMMQLQKHSSNFLGGGFRASGSNRKSVTDAGYSSVGRASDCRFCSSQMVPGSIPGGRIVLGSFVKHEVLLNSL